MTHRRAHALPTWLFLAFSFVAAGTCFAQPDSWARKNDVAYNGQDGPRMAHQPTAFPIGNKGYVIDGSGMLWEYDPAGDSWMARSVFPGGAAGNLAVGFTIGNKGYVCKLSGTVGTWEFDPADGSWTPKAAFPGATRNSAVAFALDGKGYVGTGVGSSAPYLNDLWAYDPVTDLWTQRANFPGPRARAAAFTVGGKGYVTGGTTSVGSGDLDYTSGTSEYDPVTNTWTSRANYPGTRMRMVAFSAGAKGYVGCGVFSTSASRNLFAYDPATNTWTDQGGFGDTSGRDWGFALAIAGKGYIGGGGLYGDHTKNYNDLWCFDPATVSFTPRQYLGGMDLRDCGAFGIGATGHFLAGGRGSDRPTSESWDYAPATNTWSKRADITANYEASATFVIGAQGYKVGGCFRDGTSYFSSALRYDPAADAWTFVTALATAERRAWAVGFSANGKGYVGLGQGVTLKNDLWQYDPLAGTWTRKADLPGAARQKAVAFRIGHKVYVGTGLGGGSVRLRDMWEYDTDLDTWTQKADFGGTARYGAVAFAIGGKGYIATGDDGSLLKDLWEYDPVADSWTRKADFGGVGRRAAMAFVVGAKAYVGTGEITSGGNSYAYDMWEYTPVDAASAVRLSPKVLLDGPYDSGSGLMGDGLRTAGVVPLAEPYTALGYDQVTSGGERTSSAVLAVTGTHAIVDWVMVELRHPARPDIVVASACALLQRDGDVVATDGSSPVTLVAPAGSYYIAVRHRNHLGAMTAAPVPVSATPAPADLTLPATATYGVEARKIVGGRALLWAGDVGRDARIAYTGAGNDRDPILVLIGGTVPTAVVNGGYWGEDVNLDGTVKYTGFANDRDPILQNIGGVSPTVIRFGQLP